MHKNMNLHVYSQFSFYSRLMVHEHGGALIAHVNLYFMEKYHWERNVFERNVGTEKLFHVEFVLRIAIHIKNNVSISRVWSFNHCPC